MRTVLVTLATLLAGTSAFAHGPTWLATPTWEGPKRADVVCRGPHGVLPAGAIQWNFNWYQPILPGCARPTFALVAEGLQLEWEVFLGETSGRSALKRASKLALAPGYPWVVHSRSVGFRGNGMVVVLGLFASKADALRYRERLREMKPPPKLLKVLDAEKAAEQLPHDDNSFPAVTHVTAPAPVPAFSRKSVDHIERVTWKGAPPKTPLSRYRAHVTTEWTKRYDQAKPVCHVPPGSLFEISHLDADPRPYTHRWRPVRCGRKLAYVRVDATSFASIVWRHRDGSTRLTQVTLLKCDAPTHTTWKLDARGHRTAAHTSPLRCMP